MSDTPNLLIEDAFPNPDAWYFVRGTTNVRVKGDDPAVESRLRDLEQSEEAWCAGAPTWSRDLRVLLGTWCRTEGGALRWVCMLDIEREVGAEAWCRSRSAWVTIDPERDVVPAPIHAVLVNGVEYRRITWARDEARSADVASMPIASMPSVSVGEVRPLIAACLSGDDSRARVSAEALQKHIGQARYYLNNTNYWSAAKYFAEEGVIEVCANLLAHPDPDVWLIAIRILRVELFLTDDYLGSGTDFVFSDLVLSRVTDRLNDLGKDPASTLVRAEIAWAASIMHVRCSHSLSWRLSRRTAVFIQFLESMLDGWPSSDDRGPLAVLNAVGGSGCLDAIDKLLVQHRVVERSIATLLQVSPEKWEEDRLGGSHPWGTIRGRIERSPQIKEPLRKFVAPLKHAVKSRVQMKNESPHSRDYRIKEMEAVLGLISKR